MQSYLLYGLVVFITLVILTLVWELTGRSKNPAAKRLRELEARRGRAREEKRESLKDRVLGTLQRVGARIRGKDESGKAAGLLRTLELAGFRSPGAAAVYHGARILLAVTFFFVPVLVTAVFGFPAAYGALAGVYFSFLGLFGPRFWLLRRVTYRQKLLRKALPDTLDLLVVCVEAGLGLNQALLKTADDVKEFSRDMSDELRIVNLEIRAGTPREQALRNLGERTDVDDIRSLAAMLIQADRFGTSVGQALRVHSDSLRTRRRQRAEETAAKTTIKLVFPLVLFIFPSLFVVILGPVIIRVIDQMAGVGGM